MSIDTGINSEKLGVFMYDAEGNEINVLTDVVEYTVSFGGKNEYGQQNPLVSLKATRMAGMSDDDLDEMISRKLEYVRAKAYEGFEYAPEPTPAPQDWVEQTIAQDSAPVQEPPPQAPPKKHNGSPSIMEQVRYAPKAAERQPGQWWVTECDEYKLEKPEGKYGPYQQLTLYEKDSEYGRVELRDYNQKKGEAWPPQVWVDTLTADGEHHDLGYPLYVVMQVIGEVYPKNNNFKVVATLVTKDLDNAKPQPVA